MDCPRLLKDNPVLTSCSMLAKKKGKTKVIQTTNFKEKEKKRLNMSNVECFICGKTGHFAKKCTERKGKKNQQGKNNSANMVVSEAEA
jgi:hypothetical protein